MFQNFRSARYRGTIVTGPWTPLMPGLFRRLSLCERRTRRFSRATGRVFFWLRHNTVESPSPGTTSCAWRMIEPYPTRVREIFFWLSSCAEKPFIVNRDRRCWSTDSSAGCGIRCTCEHGRVGITHSNARLSKVVSSVIFVKNIIFIFIRFVLLYYYNAFGAYVISLLFLYLSYLLLHLLLILLWHFWFVYPGICYNFINYPC
jgi:hypothetical protein